MRDEMFDRDYQEGRSAMNNGIDQAVRRLGNYLSTTFGAIHAVQFDAPWRHVERRKPARAGKRAGIA